MKGISVGIAFALAASSFAGACANSRGEGADLHRLPWRERHAADRGVSDTGDLGPAARLSVLPAARLQIRRAQERTDVADRGSVSSATDLMPLAQYFSQKAVAQSRSSRRRPADVAAQAKRANASVVCTSCHQEGFKGDSTQPRLAGQNHDYLQKTMTDFRTGARANNPGMTDFMKAISESDIAALAAYIAGMCSFLRRALVRKLLRRQLLAHVGAGREIERGLALLVLARAIGAAGQQQDRRHRRSQARRRSSARCGRDRRHRRGRHRERAGDRRRGRLAAAPTPSSWPAAHISAVRSLP